MAMSHLYKQPIRTFSFSSDVVYLAKGLGWVGLVSNNICVIAPQLTPVARDN
jgi:hypothetical protein